MEIENSYVVLKSAPDDPKNVLLTNKTEKKRVCEVCGHANDKTALMCKMCSNYLTNGGIQ